MGLSGKLIAAIEFKAGGDLYHELFRFNPEGISKAIPDKIHGCELHEGDLGHVGSIVTWRYTHEGKERKAKEIIEAIDEEKKLIRFKVVEGDLLEDYKSFATTVHIETNEGIDLVTWTLEYEMLHEDVGHPISLLAFIINFTEEIEAHHLPKP